MGRPFLITGCGRSGTAWAARFFTEIGHPCEHEEQFTPEMEGPLTRPEASWLAIPHLESLPEGTTLLRMMRDPYLVVRSVIARGFLSELGGPFESYVAQYRPEITRSLSHLGRAIRWVALWDEPLDDHLYRIFRAGETDAVSAAETVHHATGQHIPVEKVGEGLLNVGRKVNGTTYAQHMRLPEVEHIAGHPDGHLLALRAQRFGYRLPPRGKL
jgi:hypothetical protein